MNKVLSIIIPSYNTEKYIVDCTKTMLNSQVNDDIEILIVNDGSKDNTGSIADQLVEKYPNTVRHISKPNGGHGSAINRGIQEAIGTYARVIDGDDWVDQSSFIEYVNALKACDEDVVLTEYDRVFEKDNSKVRSAIDLPEGVYSFNDYIKSSKFEIQLHNATFKLSLLKKCRKIREHCFYVDQEYICYTYPYINQFRVIKLSVYQYRVGINEQSMSKESMIRNRDMHMNVIFDLIDFYKSESFTDSVKESLLHRISNMSRKQTDIYLLIDDKTQGKNECLSFLNRLKEESKEVYKDMPGKRSFLFRIFPSLTYDLLRR